MITCVIITIIVLIMIIVLLFIQSITYNLTNPDDGSCGELMTYSECIEPRSDFSEDAPKCAWSPDDMDNAEFGTGTCSFIESESGIKVVLFVAILSAIITAPVALTVDYMLSSVLAAPTQKSEIEENNGTDAAHRSKGSSQLHNNFETVDIAIAGDTSYDMGILMSPSTGRRKKKSII